MKKVAYPRPNLPKRGRPKGKAKFSDGPKGLDEAIISSVKPKTTDLHTVAHEAYKKAKAKVAVNGLTPRQIKQHEKAAAAVERWISKLTRAANEVAKHTKTVKRYERLIAKVAATK